MECHLNFNVIISYFEYLFTSWTVTNTYNNITRHITRVIIFQYTGWDKFRFIVNIRIWEKQEFIYRNMLVVLFTECIISLTTYLSKWLDNFKKYLLVYSCNPSNVFSRIYFIFHMLHKKKYNKKANQLFSTVLSICQRYHLNTISIASTILFPNEKMLYII